MQTLLAEFIRGTPEGSEAEAILRKCVHCGFCTATCPTYQLLGDELDSPRGRIYLIKQALEGAPVTARTRQHLDRCLTCRSCETTCPSGVRYGRLVDIGRQVVEARTPPRSPWQRLQRAALAFTLPRTALFGALLMLGRMARPLLTGGLREKIPARIEPAGERPAARHTRRVIALAGCVQPALAPAINAAAARVLDRLGISMIEGPGAGCCGALRFHLNQQEAGRDDMRALIDRWWPLIERDDAESVVITASGCGATVEDYGHALEHDPDYRHKAARIALLTKDIAEVVAAEAPALEKLLQAQPAQRRLRVAFQSPCSLQHGMQVRGVVEGLLTRAGYELTPVPEAHLCCGSAGTYSILQPELSMQLRERKLSALAGGAPDVVATSNVGCLAHLQGGTQTPVRHWIQLLDDVLQG